MRWLKNILLAAFLIAIIVASFWVSFWIGRQMLSPVEKNPIEGTAATVKESQELDLLKSQMTFEVVTEGAPVAGLQKTVTAVIKKKPASSARQVKKINSPSAQVYLVQVGAFASHQNAKAQVAELTNEGFSAWIQRSGKLWKVVLGSFNDLSDAENKKTQLEEKGYEAVIRR